MKAQAEWNVWSLRAEHLNTSVLRYFSLASLRLLPRFFFFVPRFFFSRIVNSIPERFNSLFFPRWYTRPIHRFDARPIHSRLRRPCKRLQNPLASPPLKDNKSRTPGDLSYSRVHCCSSTSPSTIQLSSAACRSRITNR